MLTAPSIASLGSEQDDVAARFRSLGRLLDLALARYDARIQHCALNPVFALDKDVGAIERRDDSTTIRAHSDRRILLRGQPASDAVDATIPALRGERLASADLVEALDEFGLRAALLSRDRNDAAIVDTSLATFRLVAHAKTDADGISTALTAAFGLPELAAQLAGAVLVPVAIGHAWRRGVRTVDRAVAVLRGAHKGRSYVDCFLLDAASQPLLALLNVCFVSPRAAGLMTIIDPEAILAEGPAAAETRLCEELAARIADALEMDVAAVPLDSPLGTIGVDSLGAAELRAYTAVMLGTEFPLSQLAPAATLRDVVRIAVSELTRRYAPHEDGFGVARFLNPQLAQRLRLARLDRAYVRGSGSILTDTEGCEVIDFVSQYGALPFGHNPAAIWDALAGVRDAQAPAMVGLSLPVAAGRLAERLTALAPPGLDRAFFCSSGAEAIEAAIKLARAGTARTAVLSTEGAFHGLTLGALSATGRAAYQQPFGAPIAGFDKVPFGDIEALRETVRQHPAKYAAFIVEPIQSEGGIIAPPPCYLTAAAKLCRAHGIVFVADEIQTGLGRCGEMFASSAFGLEPDVITLAKALGGGLMPIGAVLYRAELATLSFMLRHGSTFGNNALACAAAMATLDRLTANDGQLMRWVAERGAHLKAQLDAVRHSHPAIVREIRGRGFLLGVAFSDDPVDYDGSVAALLCRSEAFGLILSSYLLNRHRVRVAPTMNHGSVLRIEPALDAPPSLFEPLVKGVQALAEALDRGDSPAVLGHVLGLDPAQTPQFADRRTRVARSAPVATEEGARFAFLIHLMGWGDLARFDPSLAQMGPESIGEILAATADQICPQVIRTVELNTVDGRRAVGDLILIPHTGQELLDLPPVRARQLIDGAIELAVERKAEIVGLGGFISVVTDGGTAIGPSPCVPLTTGNALTALTAVQAIESALQLRDDDVAPTAAMVFGAFGSIGAAIAKLLARRVRRLVLIVRRENEAVMRRRADALRAGLLRSLAANGAPPPGSAAAALLGAEGAAAVFVVTHDPAPHWPACGIVVTATSALGELVSGASLAPRAVVCDVSRPVNVSRDLRQRRPDVVLIEGGVLKPPPPFDSGIDLGIGRDRAYACMAETMLLAIERDAAHCSVGNEIDLGNLPWFADAARRAGFTLP
jgi:acetylornithine/succinyldiaminopimelate/putrescine aminotransferase/predicted amino acid dehydrogenase